MGRAWEGRVGEDPGPRNRRDRSETVEQRDTSVSLPLSSLTGGSKGGVSWTGVTRLRREVRGRPLSGPVCPVVTSPRTWPTPVDPPPVWWPSV